MMIDSHAPLVFWGEAVNTAVYLHQRTPNEGLTRKDDRAGNQEPYSTPYEMLQAFGKPSDDKNGNEISFKATLSTTFRESTAMPVDSSMSRNVLENSTEDPSHV
jgi:hypothetical protein